LSGLTIELMLDLICILEMTDNEHQPEVGDRR
jgi:hypothetical protein